MSKQQVSTKSLPTPRGVWSQAIHVIAGSDLLFVSGLTSRNPDHSVYGEDDITAQTERVLENLTEVLRVAGAALADVVKVTVFVRDIDEFDKIHAVRRRFFTEPYPASTMVQISRLVDPRSLIEIEAVAVLPAR